MSNKTSKTEPLLPYDQIAIKTQIKILEDLVDEFLKVNNSICATDIQDLSASAGKIPSTLKYYGEIGWLEVEKPGFYIPNKDLEMFFGGIDSEENRKNLVNLLNKSEIGDKLFHFVVKKEPVSIDEVISYLGKIFSLHKKRIKKITRLVELYVFMSVFQEETGTLTLLEKSLEQPKIPTETFTETVTEVEEIHSVPVDLKKNYPLDFNWKECMQLILLTAERKNFDSKYHAKNLLFLKSIEIIDDKNVLTEIGENLYKQTYILFDEEAVTNTIYSILINYRPVKVICSYLWGYPNLNKDSIQRILLANKIIVTEITKENLSDFIQLLNRYDILKYSKKLNTVRIIYSPKASDNDSKIESFISPETPYTNIRNFRNLIRSCKEYIFWVDRHFSSRGLELIIDDLDGNVISEIKILLSINSTANFERLRKDFKRFKAELEIKGIKSNCGILVDKKTINEIHGRWIISKKQVYNIPPINSLLLGQYDEILKSNDEIPFNDWWKESKDIINDWNDIQVLIQKNQT